MTITGNIKNNFFHTDEFFHTGEFFAHRLNSSYLDFLDSTKL